MKRPNDDVTEIEQDRALAAELEQYELLANSAREREEFLCAADTKLLRALARNGDGDATAFYILRRLEEQTLATNDMKLLDTAIRSLNENAALVGAKLYRDGSFKNAEKEIFCLVALEQFGYADAHKRMRKLYRAAAEHADAADCAVLECGLLYWATEILAKGVFTAYTVDIDHAEKPVPDYKRAYAVNVRLTERNGRETETERVFLAYLRDKRADTERVVERTYSFMADAARRYNLLSGDIYVDGKRVRHFVGGTENGAGGTENDGVHVISGVGLNVTVSDDGLLENRSDKCERCGGIVNSDGVCRACGHRRTPAKTDSENITVRRGKSMEALFCTQCGAPVALDRGGKTALCSACGTTFAVKGDALADGIVGLNYKSLRADMPEDAEMPDIKFVRAKIADDKISAVLPHNFIVMSEQLRRLKYPMNAPKYIYTTPDSTVNLCFTPGERLEERAVYDFGRQMLAVMRSMHPQAQFGEAKCAEANGKKVFSFDMITVALDQHIYNSFFIFSLDGTRVIGSWNCLAKDRWFWSPVFELAVKTLDF